MKIFKHTFKIPQLAVVNDELVEVDPKEETYTFTLLHSGIGVFEENYGKSLIGALMAYQKLTKEEQVVELLDDKRFISELAAASYVKMENGKFENNRATADEFKHKEVAEHLSDIDFIVGLIQMASATISNNTKQKTQGKTKKQ